MFFGPNCTIATPIHPFRWQERNIKFKEDGTAYDDEYGKPITIHSNCWIASNVMIAGGLMMGNAASVIGFAVAGIVIFFVAVKVDLSILSLVFLPLEFAGLPKIDFGFPELILHYLERHLSGFCGNKIHGRFFLACCLCKNSGFFILICV